MASTGHNYGPSCLLHTASNTFTRRASKVFIDPPSIKAQFFYCSTLPIDDPLSPVPPPPSGPPKATRLPPRPFSIHDNKDLEEAWLSIHRQDHAEISRRRSSDKLAAKGPTSPESTSANQNDLTQKFEDHRQEKARNRGAKVEAPRPSSRTTPTTAKRGPIKNQPSALEMDHNREVSQPIDYPAEQPKSPQPNGPDLTLCDDPEHVPFSETVPVKSEEIRDDEVQSNLRRQRSLSPFRRKEKAKKNQEQAKMADVKGQTVSYRRLSGTSQKRQDSLELGSSPSERNTTGTPFLRVPSRMGRSRSRTGSPDRNPEYRPAADADTAEEVAIQSPSRPMFQRFKSGHSRDSSQQSQRSKPRKAQVVKVVTGVSRLHVVEMPSLKMGPIYWDPVHDVSSVVRGTWFYKETMWPVESDLANQLEEGYEYIKPWTPTYVDELNSCQEIGPDAELKVVHRIWPSDEPNQEPSRPSTSKDRELLLDTSEVKLGADEMKHRGAIMAAAKPENRAAGVLDGFDDPVRLFARSSIIYANAYEGQILSPGQLPSVARGRRPLAKIRKAQPVGVTVVRGFDYSAWEKVHPPKKSTDTKIAYDSLETMRTATSATAGRARPRVACLSAEETPRVTDLVLVIHGIGQKLSERVESFHFTHSINSFRRQVNIEIQSQSVKPWLREGMGSIMVLPVNWRSKMKLEDGGPQPEPNRKDPDSSKNQFTLKDITAESLPAVRNLISDVMLDIPYYLSHHKPKMIEAVIQEANRIYRLWCNNNPLFHDQGRVHLIAHSLGSVMALDILSKQPTKLPKALDFRNTMVRTDILEFDTKSLFFCGSPAGFFLLLHRAPLLPRKTRNKPEADGEDNSSSVAGETDTYGCLAVDNLYNVMHQNDPVAYRLNACVDVDHANALQQAFVPSAVTSWGQYFGSMFKGNPVVPAKALEAFPQRPTMASMPSAVEMETHNFTREEVAEKRMLLLNDNGQIDYTLRSGGGPLEIQYLNMLSAHSSYWIMQDFVRFLVVEIGRKPGKSQTVNSFKSVKKAWVKK